jgi:hypothetical protein
VYTENIILAYFCAVVIRLKVLSGKMSTTGRLLNSSCLQLGQVIDLNCKAELQKEREIVKCRSVGSPGVWNVVTVRFFFLLTAVTSNCAPRVVKELQ